MTTLITPRQKKIIERMREVAAMPRLVILDTETTGLDNKAEVIDLAVIDMQGVTLMDVLIRCQDGIPTKASDIHGITEAVLEEQGRPFPETWQEFCEIITGYPVMIYNVEFDWKLLSQTAARYGLGMPQIGNAHCLMLAYSAFVGEAHWRHQDQYKYQKLSHACECFDIEQPGAH